jgi:hypothetical protein
MKRFKTTLTINTNETFDAFMISDLLHLTGLAGAPTSDKELGFTEYVDGGIKITFTKQTDLFKVQDVLRYVWDNSKK